MSGTAPRSALAADGVLLGITAFWATSFVVVKDALSSADPFTFLALRFGVAALACTALAWRVGWHRGSVAGGVKLAPWLFLGYALQTAGLEHTTPARSAFLTGLCVLFVPFVAWALLGRRPRAQVLLGVALAAAGMYLLTLYGKDGPAPGTSWLGDGLTLGCAVAYAFHVTLTERYAASSRPSVLVAAQVWGVFFLSLPCLLFFPVRFASTPHLWTVVAYTGVLATAVAISLQAWAQTRTSAVRAALVFSLEPVFTAALGAYLGRDVMTATEWAGGVLIVLGVLAGELPLPGAER